MIFQKTLLFNEKWEDIDWCWISFQNLWTFVFCTVISILPRTTRKNYISTGGTFFHYWSYKYCFSQQVLCKKEIVSSFQFSKCLNLPSFTFKASALVGSTHQMGGFTGIPFAILLSIAFKISSAYCSCKATNFLVIATASN
jgi:hypothetical protein